MFQDTRRLRLLWLTLACATLAACGGGGGGGGGGTPPPPPPPAPPPASESAYLQAEFVASDSNNQVVRVWDPANPSVAVQNVKLVMSNGILWTGSHLVFSDATRYDAATRTVTTLGHAKVFYDNDGKLYSIDLRGGQSHAPVQLSNAVDVFLPRSAIAMNAAGDDAWVDAQGGTHDWAIRSTTSATAAPVSVQRVLAPLRDATTGVPQYFFASLGAQDGIHVTATTYQVFDATFAPATVPAVGTMVASDAWVGVDAAAAGTAYVRIAGQLRALHWTASGVTVDSTDLHDFANPGQVVSVADAQTLWFTDGSALMGVAGGVVQAGGTFSVAPNALFDSGNYVAAGELIATSAAPPQILTQVETLRKADGVRTLVAAATADVVVIGASSDGQLLIAGTSEAGRAVSLAAGDKSSETTLGASLQYVGAVRSATARIDRAPAVTAVLACTAGATDGFCAAGDVSQVSLAGGVTSLGTMSATAPWLRGDAIAGLSASLSGQTFLSSPGGFGNGEVDRRDAWQFTPGTAGSLARVTSNLP